MLENRDNLTSSPWHAIEADEVITRFETSREGLTLEAVRLRQAQYGLNELPPPQGTSLLKILLRQFQSFVLILLISAALFSYATSDSIEAAAIVAIIILNVVIGFYQEYRAERAMLALHEFAKPVCRVRRGGVVSTEDTSSLVPGDIVLLEAGDHIPADCRVTLGHDLQCNEAALTGESLPVIKEDRILEVGTPLAERSSMLYLGTSVVRGYGEAVVVATGQQTELGRIASMLSVASTESRSPLQKAIDSLSKMLGLASIGLVVVVFLLGLLREEPSLGLVILAVSIAVAAIPEGLPAIVTIALSLGTIAMAKRHALIRKLAAIETLGTATVICTDKTGTLTQGTMEVRHVYTLDNEQFNFILAGCETARLTSNEASGDPTEIALLRHAQKAGIEQMEVEERYPLLMLVPFDSDRRMMSTLRKKPDGSEVLLTKGAPDIILAKCTHELANGENLELDDHRRMKIELEVQRHASEGMRMIAAAKRDIIKPSSGELEQDLTFVGIAAIADPPRQESREMVASCTQAGIKVMMITGDHPTTAIAIARELGIAENEDQVMTGTELDAMDQNALSSQIESIRVFARVTAEHKFRIVEALTAKDEIVAMTGDGVNDAPALAHAHIGMAMGRTGTDVAKESSDIIILDDNFKTIAKAVEYGRSAFTNIRKSIEYLLTGNVAELALMGLCFAIGLPVPLTALQILWINLITDGLPALSLAAEGIQPNVMRDAPRRAHEGIISRPILIRMVIFGVLNAVLFTIFYFGSLQNFTTAQAQTALFLLIITSDMIRSLGYRQRSSIFSYKLKATLPLLTVIILSVFIQLLITLLPLGRQVFGLVSLTGEQLLTVGLLSLVPLLIVELWKMRKRD